MTQTYQRVALAIIALSFMALVASVLKKEFFPAPGPEVSFTIDGWSGDPSWWNPRYNGYSPGNAGDRWTFGGAHSYTTRQLMGQRL